MKKFCINVQQKEFQFEYENGTVWLIENKNSFTNYGQNGWVNFNDAEAFALVMLQAMGRIRRSRVLHS